MGYHYCVIVVFSRQIILSDLNPHFVLQIMLVSIILGELGFVVGSPSILYRRFRSTFALSLERVSFSVVNWVCENIGVLTLHFLGHCEFPLPPLYVMCLSLPTVAVLWGLLLEVDRGFLPRGLLWTEC